MQRVLWDLYGRSGRNGKSISPKRTKNGKVVNEFLGFCSAQSERGDCLLMHRINFDCTVAGYGMFGQKVLNATRMAMFDPQDSPSKRSPTTL